MKARALEFRATLFLDLTFDEIALGHAQAVNEELTIKMIDFMLNRDREQPLGLERVLGAFEILVRDRHRVEAFDFFRESRNRKAAFLENDLLAPFQDHG